MDINAEIAQFVRNHYGVAEGQETGFCDFGAVSAQAFEYDQSSGGFRRTVDDDRFVEIIWECRNQR